MHQTLFSACEGGGYTGFGTLCALYQTIEQGTREQSLMERTGVGETGWPMDS